MEAAPPGTRPWRSRAVPVVDSDAPQSAEDDERQPRKEWHGILHECSPRVLHELLDELLARNEQTACLDVANSDLNKRDCEDGFPKFNDPVLEHIHNKQPRRGGVAVILGECPTTAIIRRTARLAPKDWLARAPVLRELLAPESNLR